MFNLKNGFTILLVLSITSSLVMAKAQKRVADIGPRISDAELFGALDLTIPALKDVQTLVTSGDLEKAKHALANYYRQRKNPKYDFNFPGTEWWTPLPNPNTPDAEKTIKEAV